MRKKRLIGRRAQVSAFIIVGMLIFFIFITLIALTARTEKGKLEAQYEEIVAKALGKEAMRIFVEDCLEDELDNGLWLLGRQGGLLWSDQPGGTREFVDFKTGVRLPGEEDKLGARVFYAIVNEEYPARQEAAYPCDTDDDTFGNAPEYCKYKYPNTTVWFGMKSVLTPETLQADLERFLLNRTLWCVENFTKGNISQRAVIETKEMDLKLKIKDDGISVKVDYPLTFSIGEMEFFHLSKFDFFHPSKLKQLLDAAITFPLEQDQKFVDFKYEEEVLKLPFFSYGYPDVVDLGEGNTCGGDTGTLCQRSLHSNKYIGLGIEMEKTVLNDRGDDLFIFKPAGGKILKREGEFQFRFVRQNRPPALDYVSLDPCTLDRYNENQQYDYLVIKKSPDGAEIDQNKIEITLSARDPDDDKINDEEVQYDFGTLVFGNPNKNIKPAWISGDDILTITANELISDTDWPMGIYRLIPTATDKHGATDSQEVRILLDRGIQTSVQLKTPYDDPARGSNQVSTKISDTYYVSREDPAFIEVNYPIDSVYEDINSRELVLSYVKRDGTPLFEYKSPNNDLFSATGNNKFSFPGTLTPAHDLGAYKNKIDISSWNDLLNQGDYFEIVSSGKLKFSFGTSYCQNSLQNNPAEIDVVVKECIPYQNPEHPFPYMSNDPEEWYKYEVTYDADGNIADKTKINDFNPFLASHTCCLGTADNPDGWEIAPENYVCFTNPEPVCKEGYFKKQERKCGPKDRGNICNGDFVYTPWEGVDTSCP